jgi:hypothetical protein
MPELSRPSTTIAIGERFGGLVDALTLRGDGVGKVAPDLVQNSADCRTPPAASPEPIDQPNIWIEPSRAISPVSTASPGCRLPTASRNPASALRWVSASLCGSAMLASP